jgi:hypothetical protein
MKAGHARMMIASAIMLAAEGMPREEAARTLLGMVDPPRPVGPDLIDRITAKKKKGKRRAGARARGRRPKKSSGR